MTTSQTIMSAVHKMDQNGKLVVAAIASAVLQTQRKEEESAPKKKTRKGGKNERSAH